MKIYISRDFCHCVLQMGFSTALKGFSIMLVLTVHDMPQNRTEWTGYIRPCNK
jgi:hypothetical protein